MCITRGQFAFSNQMKTVKVSRYLNFDGILHLLGKYVSGSFGVRELLGTACMFYEGRKDGGQIAGSWLHSMVKQKVILVLSN